MLLSILYGRLPYGQQITFSLSLYDTSIYPLHQVHLSRQDIVNNSILFSFHIYNNNPALYGLLIVYSRDFFSFL